MKLLHWIESARWCRVAHVKQLLCRHQRDVRNSKQLKRQLLQNWSCMFLPICNAFPTRNAKKEHDSHKQTDKHG
uniref:Uncharacterized protein n=1 Tax=Romanomermis culicivorax TaxID=13658 RepID=A0A915KR87_ROMCU